MPTTNRLKAIDKETRTAVASAGGSGRAAALSADQRSAVAAKGAATTNSPENYAQRIARQWRGLPAARRRVIQQTLSECNGLGVVAPEPRRTRGKIASPAEPTS